MPALMSAFNLFMSGSVGIMLMNLPEPPPEHMRYSASSSKPDLLAFARLLRPQTLPIVGGATDVAREHEGKSEGVGTMSSEGERRRERKKKEKGECWHVGVGAAVTTSCSVCLWGVLYHGARSCWFHAGTFCVRTSMHAHTRNRDSGWRAVFSSLSSTEETCVRTRVPPPRPHQAGLPNHTSSRGL